jgi:hypothetical protein
VFESREGRLTPGVKQFLEAYAGMELPGVVIRVVFIAVAFIAFSTASFAKDPVRLPNGVYTYSLFDGKGPPAFTSTIDVRSNGPSFFVSETVKLPNGQIATTNSVWSNATLFPHSFDVRQGKIRLHSLIERDALTLRGRSKPFLRISPSVAILPSVGLISTDLMFAYFLIAHPGEMVTLAELQNDQTVIVRPGKSLATSGGQFGRASFSMTKQEKHGASGDLERIVGSLDRRTGIIKSLIATPGDARIVLVHYSSNVH